MIKHDYYLVTTYVNECSLFTTCAYADGKYFRIKDFEEYTKTGEGISDEEIKPDAFVMINKKFFTASESR